jgi:hypothetical protein
VAKKISQNVAVHSRLSSNDCRTTVYVDVGEITVKCLFKAIAERVLEDNLSQWELKQLSIVNWSFATLGLKHCQLLEQTKIELTDRLQNSDSDIYTTSYAQPISNLLWYESYQSSLSLVFGSTGS